MSIRFHGCRVESCPSLDKHFLILIDPLPRRPYHSLKNCCNQKQTVTFAQAHLPTFPSLTPHPTPTVARIQKKKHARTKLHRKILYNAALSPQGSPHPEIHPQTNHTTTNAPTIMAAMRSVCVFPPVCAMRRTRPTEFLRDVLKEENTSFYIATPSSQLSTPTQEKRGRGGFCVRARSSGR